VTSFSPAGKAAELVGSAAGGSTHQVTHGPHRELVLGEKSQGGACGDQVGEVVRVVGGDQHDVRAEVREVLDESVGDVEAALVSEVEVDESDVRPQSGSP
jgi:ethanolamine utilization microcompartment shell protein EutL